MKIEIKFNKRIKKPEDIIRLLQLENLNEHLLDIINDKNSCGKNIVNWKGETIFTIKFKEFEVEDEEKK